MKKFFLFLFSWFIFACSLLPAVAQTNPAPAVVATGSKVLITVTADGTQPFSYVWLKAAPGSATFTPIAGQTTNQLVIASVTIADAGQYKVEVSNPYGKTVSTTAILDSGSAPAITSFGIQVIPSPAP